MDVSPVRPSVERVRRGRRTRVLIADKNAHFRETVRRVLARFPTCIISGEASTISEVMDKVSTSRIDLLLLDVEMVTADHLAELKRLATGLPHLKVAVLLSDDTLEYRQAVQRHGGHFSVAKEGIEDQIPLVLESLH